MNNTLPTNLTLPLSSSTPPTQYMCFPFKVEILLPLFHGHGYGAVVCRGRRGEEGEQSAVGRRPPRCGGSRSRRLRQREEPVAWPMSRGVREERWRRTDPCRCRGSRGRRTMCGTTSQPHSHTVTVIVTITDTTLLFCNRIVKHILFTMT